MFNHYALQKPSMNQKTHQFNEEQDLCDLFYEKPYFRSIGHMSPTSTSHQDQNITLWESEYEDRSVINEKHKENLATINFGAIEENVIGLSVQKYSEIVSEYLKNTLKIKSEQTVDFLSLNEFESLSVQKQQYAQLLDDYNKSLKSTHKDQQILNTQNSVFKAFLEEITYLNYQEINFEIIWILLQMFTFKNGDTVNNAQKFEFFSTLASSEKLSFINLKFLNNEKAQVRDETHFLNFLEKLYDVFQELYIHYTLFQFNSDGEEGESNMLKRGLKLFSSKRDFWDSDEQDDECLTIPSKRTKFT